MWYYLREICRIPMQGGVGVPYKANRGNIAQAWCTLHGIDSWLTLPRQQGKTQSSLAMIAWAYSFGTSSSTFIFINKDGGNAKENLQRLKDQIECLPDYLKFDQILEEDETSGKLKVVKAVKNATSMRHPITKNRIIIKSKATNYESALSLARGLSAPLLCFDEPEFTPHIKTIVENSVSTYETAARNAKANGALYGRIFTCTPRQHRTWILVIVLRKTLLIAGNSSQDNQQRSLYYGGTFNDYPLRSTSKRMEIQCPYDVG